MNPIFTSRGALKRVKFTVAELRYMDNVLSLLALLEKFGVVEARNATDALRKIKDSVNDKQVIDFVGDDGFVQLTIFGDDRMRLSEDDRAADELIREDERSREEGDDE